MPINQSKGLIQKTRELYNEDETSTLYFNAVPLRVELLVTASAYVCPSRTHRVDVSGASMSWWQQVWRLRRRRNDILINVPSRRETYLNSSLQCRDEWWLNQTLPNRQSVASFRTCCIVSGRKPSRWRIAPRLRRPPTLLVATKRSAIIRTAQRDKFLPRGSPCCTVTCTH